LPRLEGVSSVGPTKKEALTNIREGYASGSMQPGPCDVPKIPAVCFPVECRRSRPVWIP